MSFYSSFQTESRPLPLALSGISSLLRFFRRREGRSNRLDRDHLPDSLQRDLGLVDGRGIPGGCNALPGEVGHAASLMHLPRGL